MLYPSNFEQKIGFNRIRELLKLRCLSPMGEELVVEAKFSDEFECVKEWLSQTAEMLHICQFESDFPIDHYIDIQAGLKKAKVEGMHLEVQEIYDLRRSLDTVKALLGFFNSRESQQYPTLRKLLSGIKVYPAIAARIDTILSSNGRIKDNASRELVNIRASMRSAQEKVSKRINAIMKDAQSQGWVEKEAQVTLRDGRMVLPVNATDKRKLKGLVHDESSTGKTCFIEPAEVVEINNELKELAFSELREIIRILTLFTDFLRPYVPDLEESVSLLGKMDFIRAKALFAHEISAVQPYLESKPWLRWENGFHPLLYLNHKKDGKTTVPLNITLTDQNRILVISGPNAGGKSVCLQTLGLLQYMLQCGLLVPVKDGSEFGIFKNIFIDIGDEQSIENDLSTYSSHLLNMKNFLRYSNENTMILIDEMGAGTEPTLGGAIAESILDKLNQSSCYGCVTTHYTNLKQFASQHDGLVNGAMLFDTNKMEPQFILEIGKPGSSFAFEISHRIGLPEEILKNAKEKVGEGQVKWDKYLKDISRDKYYWERKRQDIRIAGKRVEASADELEEELEKIKKQRKEILQQAKHQAEEIVAGANKLIEKTVREIRETQASKEKTKDVRASLADFRKELSQIADVADIPLEIENKIKRGRMFLEPDETKKESKKPSEILKDEASVKVGDKVRLINQDATGEVMEVGEKSILVAFGHMITTVDEKRIEKISNAEFKTNQKVKTGDIPGWSLDKKLSFKPDIDLRGKRAEEALEDVARFIDDAIMLNVSQVKILHGKGNGILRKLIREYLSSVDLVRSFEDEETKYGGTGITVVRFSY
jgi:DNA mismatch repair protein MutS2